MSGLVGLIFLRQLADEAEVAVAEDIEVAAVAFDESDFFFQGIDGFAEMAALEGITALGQGGLDLERGGDLVGGVVRAGEEECGAAEDQAGAANETESVPDHSASLLRDGGNEAVATAAGPARHNRRHGLAFLARPAPHKRHSP